MRHFYKHNYSINTIQTTKKHYLIKENAYIEDKSDIYKQ
jgi:hypothetical protein